MEYCSAYPMMIPAMLKILKRMADSLMVLSAATFNPDEANSPCDYIPTNFAVGMERPVSTQEEFDLAAESAKHTAELTYAYINRMGNARLIPMYEAVIVWDKIHSVYIELIHDIEMMHYCKETEIHDKFVLNAQISDITISISRILEQFDENNLKLSANDIDEISCYMSDYYELGCVVWDFVTDIEELQRIADEGEIILNKLKTAVSYLKLNKSGSQEKTNDIMDHGEVTTEVPCIPTPGDKTCEGNHAVQAASGTGIAINPGIPADLVSKNDFSGKH